MKRGSQQRFSLLHAVSLLRNTFVYARNCWRSSSMPLALRKRQFPTLPIGWINIAFLPPTLIYPYVSEIPFEEPVDPFGADILVYGPIYIRPLAYYFRFRGSQGAVHKCSI